MLQIRILISTIICFLFIFKLSIGQNLVPNYSFEMYSQCPDDYGQVSRATGWKPSWNNNNPTYGTEYNNSCTSGLFGVPSNTWGNQNAATGQAYMAMSIMAPFVQTDYHENIYIKLSSPLIKGIQYKGSLKVSHTENSQYATNNIGLKFSTVSSFPINNISHINTTSVITDDVKWTDISGTFTADSAYEYVCVGNFFTDANTTVVNSCPSCPYGLYGYFIDDVEVTVAPISLPIVSFSATPTTICEGSSVQFIDLSTNTPTSWTWSFQGGTPSSSNVQNPSVTYAATGTYSVSLIAANASGSNMLVKTNYITVTNSSGVDANFTSSAPGCVGHAENFYNAGTTGGIHSWNFGPGANPATSTQENPIGIVYSSAGAKKVTHIFSTGNCSDTVTQVITINPTPLAVFTSNSPVCQSKAVNFANTGNTGNGYSHFWDFGPGAVPAGSTAISPTGVMHSSYGQKKITLTTTNQFGCTHDTSITISINKTPDATFVSTAPLCTGTGVNFTSADTTSGTLLYSWSFGTGANPFSSSIKNPAGVVYATAGKKLVSFVITNSVTGCSATSSSFVEIYRTPLSNFTAANNVCEGNLVTIVNTGDKDTTLKFSWDFGLGAGPATSNAINPQGVFYSSPGKKYITLTVSDEHCIHTTKDSITINPRPLAFAGKDTTICANRSVQLGNTAVVGNSYSWFPSSTLNNAGISNPVASPIAPVTFYILTVKNIATGCSAIDTVKVTMLASLIADAGIDGEICRGDTIQVGAALREGQYYKWMPAMGLSNTTAPNPLANPSVTTTYTLTVIGAGCNPVTDQVTITVHPLPDVHAGPNDTIARGSVTQLIAVGGLQYSWTPSNGLNNTGIFNPLANPDTTTKYIVTSIDIYGCVNSDTVTVFVVAPKLWIPSGFTPDGNQKNDILMVRGGDVKNFEFTIFNRWGQQIFYTTDINVGWDGKIQGTSNDVPEGAYVYIIKGVLSSYEPVNMTGLVNLIR